MPTLGKKRSRWGKPVISLAAALVLFIIGQGSFKQRSEAAEAHAQLAVGGLARVMQVDRFESTNSKNRTTVTYRSTVRFKSPAGQTCEGLMFGDGYAKDQTVKVFFDPSKEYSLEHFVRRWEVYSERHLLEMQSARQLWIGIGAIVIALGALVFGGFALRGAIRAW